MSKARPLRALRALATLPFLLLLACVHDFGDAPDGGPTGYPTGTLVGGAVVPAVGSFPSLEASDGARVSSVSDATLGPGATLEGDALLTNADSDDGSVFLMVIIVSIPPPAQMIVQITGQTPGTYFLNALIDLNMNGEWGDIGPNGEQEWAVQNFPVTIGPGPTAVIPLPFAYGWGNRLPVTTWMRVALTDSALPTGNWDGTGEFASGEIEDHFVTLPLAPGGGGGGPCRGKPIPRMDCGGPYFFPAGVNQIPVRCVIRNLGGNGNIDWLLQPLNGCAVTLAPALDLSGPRPIGCPDGRIVLDFIATRGNPLPCSWGYDATSLDPPSYMTATGLVAGHTDSNGAFLMAAEGAEVEEVWVEDLQAELLGSSGGVLRARALLNAAGSRASGDAFVELGIMYPDGKLDAQRAEIVDGIATAEFRTRGAGVHMVRVVRIVGPTWHYRPDKDRTLMDAATLP